MTKLSTTDNNQGNLAIGQADYEELKSISNISLKELVKAEPYLLVFPHSLNLSEDKIEDDWIIKLSYCRDSDKNAFLTTGNIMGFVGRGNTQLTIKSRFQNSEQDFFLQYMIQKVFLPNIVDLPHTTTNERIFNFLPFLLPYYLKRALSQGLYKTYQKYERNDSNLKGVIDINRHIKLNIPFSCKIAYTSRENSFDNPITQLIRHTIEFVKTKKHGRKLLATDANLKSFINQIVEATPTYSQQKRLCVINQNIKPINHPYFTEYKPLQKLCLAILRHKKLSYGDGANKVYGILFDGAWLWEEYLATILRPMEFLHPQNKLKKNPIFVGTNRSYPRYPDLYRGKQMNCTNTPEENMILDAKYKRLDEKKEIDRNDLNQIITYLHILPSNVAKLVYPTKEEKPNEKTIEVRGLGGKIETIGMYIPQKTDSKEDGCTYEWFCKEMQNCEENLRRKFAKLS